MTECLSKLLLFSQTVVVTNQKLKRTLLSRNISIKRETFVLRTGIEPARPNGRGILSPLRLPISPSKQILLLSQARVLNLN